MNFFTFTKLGRTLLLSGVAAVSAVCWVGCGGGGDDNPTNNSGNNNGNTAHTHDWGAWTVTTPATCDADGVETRTCKTDASHKETRVIPKLTGAACENNCGTDGTPGSCKTVVIGTQTWMAENLNRTTANSWCYENSAESCKKYGRLYTWAAAKTACPSRWHLPTREEWITLAYAAGATDGSYYLSDGGTAGTKLKSTIGWSDNGNGTDDFGFSALPGGTRYSSNPSFSGAGDQGNWWTATTVTGTAGTCYIGNNQVKQCYAYYRYMSYEDEAVKENTYDKELGNGTGMSVRCIKD